VKIVPVKRKIFVPIPFYPSISKNIRIFANTNAIYGPVDFRAEVLFFEENEVSFRGDFLS